MKNLLAGGVALIVSVSGALGAVYPGNNPNGGVVAGGSLTINNTANSANFTFTKAAGSFDGYLVIYIDSVPGGFTATDHFTDSSTAMAAAASGLSTSGSGARATATFANGFNADYAIVLGGDPGARLYQLANDQELSYVQIANPYGDKNLANYSFSVDWSAIGLPRVLTGNSFSFESSYVTTFGSRTLESFESLTGTYGFSSVTFNNYDTYPLAPVPEMTNASLAVFGGLVVSVGALSRIRKYLTRKSLLQRTVAG